MDKTNEKFEPIRDSADYRQIKGTFSVTGSGKFLPIQLPGGKQIGVIQNLSFRKNSMLLTRKITGQTKERQLNWLITFLFPILSKLERSSVFVQKKNGFWLQMFLKHIGPMP